MRLVTLMATLAIAALPLQGFAQIAAPPGDIEITKKKTTPVVAPKPAEGQAAKDADAAKRATEQRKRLKEATRAPAPTRPNGDVAGGIQSKSVERELKR